MCFCTWPLRKKCKQINWQDEGIKYKTPAALQILCFNTLTSNMFTTSAQSSAKWSLNSSFSFAVLEPDHKVPRDKHTHTIVKKHISSNIKKLWQKMEEQFWFSLTDHKTKQWSEKKSLSNKSPSSRTQLLNKWPDYGLMGSLSPAVNTIKWVRVRSSVAKLFHSLLSSPVQSSLPHPGPEHNFATTLKKNN